MAQKFNPLSGLFDTVLDLAKEIKYDNSTSGLAAVNLQQAIDEIQAYLDALPDPLTYIGTWDASTNTPTLTDNDSYANGSLFQVVVAGTVNFGSGPIDFEVNDKAVKNSFGIYEKWDQTDAVTSVNGKVGAVSLTTIDIPEGTNLYFTDERAQDAAGALAANSSKVSLTYNDIANTLVADIVPGSLVNADISPTANIVGSKLADASVSLTTKVSGILPIANGGTNSGTALTNSKVIVSTAGAIVESTTTTTQLGYLDATSSIQGQLDNKQPLDATLTSLAAYNANGLLTQTAPDTFTGRVIVPTSTKIAVTNGNGVAGNPSIDVVEANIQLANLAGLLPVDKGGTGTADIPLDGQLLIGNGVNYTLNNLTPGSGISIINGPGTIEIVNEFSQAGDIPNRSFSGSQNQATPVSITAFAFSTPTRSFVAEVSVSVTATVSLYEHFTIRGIRRDSDWVISITSLGDDSKVKFSITGVGDIQYISGSYPGFTNMEFLFNAKVL